ncbi:hypothetical protein AHAS_Ahas15G0182300 [Arachis hypogaea]
MGVPLDHHGVARQFNFLEEEEKGQTPGRATWYRRRGTPTIIPHLGMPLESQAWHANSQPLTGRATWCQRRGTPASSLEQEEDWACHLSSGHGTPTKEPSTHKGRGTADPGRATLVQLSREENGAHTIAVGRQTLGMPCQFNIPERRRRTKSHGRATWGRRCGTPGKPRFKKTLGVPLGFEGVAH